MAAASKNVIEFHQKSIGAFRFILTMTATQLPKGRLKKKPDKLGLLAEPPLTPPPHPNLGPVIWFGNVFGMLKT